MDKAAKLPVKTYRIPESHGYYVIGLDVFHQLHCLVGPTIEGISHKYLISTKESTPLASMGC